MSDTGKSPYTSSMSEFENNITRGDVSGRRIVVPKEAKLGPRIKPHISQLLQGSYCVAALELKRLVAKAELDGLNSTEMRKFKDLTETVVRLAREEREQEKRFNIADLTEDQFIELSKEAIKFLQEGGIPKDSEGNTVSTEEGADMETGGTP